MATLSLVILPLDRNRRLRANVLYTRADTFDANVGMGGGFQKFAVGGWVDWDLVAERAHVQTHP